MPYLPTSCDDCRLVALLPMDETGQSPACVSCAGAVRVIPGCSYAEGDVPIFSELSEVVRQASLPSSAAQRLVDEIERGCALDDDHATFVALMSQLPSLKPIHLVLEAFPARRRQALLMLETILGDAATTRPSGTIAAALPSASAYGFKKG